MKNYDLNIWDIWSYQTEGKITGGWTINAYPLIEGINGILVADMRDEVMHTLHLRDHDVRIMGLGVNTDDDFWWDAEAALDSGPLSRKVRNWLLKLVGGELDGSSSVS